MDDNKLLSIIDFGSSKIRLGIYNEDENYKFVLDTKIYDNLNNFNEIDISETVYDIIIKSEKETNKNLKNLNVMIDSLSCLSVDLSIKKKIDKSFISKLIIENLIYETKNLIKKFYSNYKILHLIIINYNFDGKIFNKIPDKFKAEELILDIKFILIEKKIISNIRNHFKSNHVAVKNIYNSSYIKTLSYIKNFENFDIKVFIDIGFVKTSILIYQNDKLVFINYIPVGGQHITSDISKLMNKDLNESEKIKKSLKQTNINLNNHKSDDLCIKIIHARVEEIIDLSFKNFINLNSIKNKKSILIFTGEGSKILSKNSIYLKEDYNFFNDMSFFEENSDIICKSGYDYTISEKLSEATLIPKKSKKQGLFEKLFYKLAK